MRRGRFFPGLLLAVVILFFGRESAQAAILKSLQTNLATLAASSTVHIATVTLPAAVDPNKAFLVFGMNVTSGDGSCSLVSGQITGSGTTLTFQRSGGVACPATTIRWYVAEFVDGVRVLRGSQNMAASTTDINLGPQNSFNLTKSFPIITLRSPDGSLGADTYINAKIANDAVQNRQELQLISNVVPNTGNSVEWQVVEYADCNVQTNAQGADFNIASATTTTVSAALTTPVDPERAWLLLTYRTQSTAGIGPQMVRGWITPPSTLSFKKSVSGATVNLTWYLVEFTDGTLVRHNTGNALASGTPTGSWFTVPFSDPKTSIATTGGVFYRGGETTLNSVDDPGVATVTLTLTTPENLQLTRARTDAIATFSLFVVEFEPAADDGGFFIQD